MNNTGNTSLSLMSVLLTIFVVLKLTDNIDWSWWWVLSPIWMPFTLIIGGVSILIASMIIYYSFKKSSK
jgi:ABC-type antimicrobial peptide transport system permease subunit